MMMVERIEPIKELGATKCTRLIDQFLLDLFYLQGAGMTDREHRVTAANRLVDIIDECSKVEV
jgi:hypothetical protein